MLFCSPITPSFHASARKKMNHLQRPRGVDRQVQIRGDALAIGAGKRDRLEPPVGRVARRDDRGGERRIVVAKVRAQLVEQGRRRFLELRDVRHDLDALRARVGRSTWRASAGAAEPELVRGVEARIGAEPRKHVGRVTEGAAGRDEPRRAVVSRPFGDVPRHVEGAERARAQRIGGHRHRGGAVEVRTVLK